MGKTIENVEEFLKGIEEVIGDFDVMTSGTFGEHCLLGMDITIKDIEKINLLCKKALKNRNYYAFLKTSLWKGGKYALFRYMYKGEGGYCSMCGKRMGVYDSVLHHVNYKELISPKNCVFLCSYKCHKILHKM